MSCCDGLSNEGTLLNVLNSCLLLHVTCAKLRHARKQGPSAGTCLRRYGVQQLDEHKLTCWYSPRLATTATAATMKTKSCEGRCHCSERLHVTPCNSLPHVHECPGLACQHHKQHLHFHCTMHWACNHSQCTTAASPVAANCSMANVPGM